MIASGRGSQFGVCVGDEAPASDRSAAEWITAKLERHAVLVPIIKVSEIEKSADRYRKLIVIGSPETNEVANKLLPKSVLEEIPAGGYGIRFVGPPGKQVILVAGRDRQGTWNGAITLSRLLRQEAGRLVLPRVEIDDWPDVPLRGVIQMIDYLLPPSLPYKAYAEGILDFRQLIDRMVEFKLNALIIHAADHPWRIPGVGRQWPPTYSAYRGAEFWRQKVQEIIAYARHRQVKVYLLLFHTLDGQGRVKHEDTDVCGTDPETEAALRRQFESYTKWFPDLEGYAIHRSEYRRCRCEECAKIRPSEELLRYLNHYSAILKRNSPSATLAFCPFPEEYYPYLAETKHRLPADIRNFLWADWHRGQVGFLASIKSTHEYSWFDDFANNWYWVYTNALIDIQFPRAEYFLEVGEFCASKRVEAVMGQFSFGRTTDYNSLALAQYTWNSTLLISTFRKMAVGELYGSLSGLDLVAAHQLYEEAAAAYVRLRLNPTQLGQTPTAGAAVAAADNVWRDARDQRVSQELAGAESKTTRLVTLLQKAAERSVGLQALRLRGWDQDTRILGHELELRRKIRAAFLKYQSAAKADRPGTRRQELAESWKLIVEARRLCLTLEQERAERGMLILAPINNSARQTAAADKLTEIVALALTRINQGEPVPPNVWQEADLFWRRYVVW